MAEKNIIKISDDTFRLSTKHGNGTLRREVWVDENGHIVRYNLAYINQSIFLGDNGRGVGCDNAHQFHHKHYLGNAESVEFSSFENIEKMFMEDWLVFRSKK